MDVIRHIIKNDGLLGMYAGMESTFWRYAAHVTLIVLALIYSLFADMSGGVRLCLAPFCTLMINFLHSGRWWLFWVSVHLHRTIAYCYAF
jgi:glucose-6-phosphate-specific signal transduction histidine kinase